MSTIISINLAVVTVLVILLLGSSVPTFANGDYGNPSSETYQKPPVETPKGSSNITCQGFLNACPGHGPYKCCEGLVCRTLPVGGVFFCLPPLGPNGMEEEHGTCRSITEACIDHGDYKCCGDLSCVPGSSANVVGAGVCLPMGRTRTRTRTQRKDECQKQAYLCQPYGQYQCCADATCFDLRNLPTSPQPQPQPPATNTLPQLPTLVQLLSQFFGLPQHRIDTSTLPPGLGVCVSLPK